MAAHWNGAPDLVSLPNQLQKLQRGEPTMQNLTSSTMTELRLERLLSTELVLHPPTMTLPIIQGLEVLRIVVNLVRRFEFPLVELSVDVLALMAVGLGVGFWGGARRHCWCGTTCTCGRVIWSLLTVGILVLCKTRSSERKDNASHRVIQY